MEYVEVRHVYSEKAGLEAISKNQMSTTKDHGGKILVHTFERGFGDNYPDVTLAGQRMKPFYFNPFTEKELQKQYDGPVHDNFGKLIGWNRVWEVKQSEGGVFHINTWSINEPHIHPHVSDYLFIV